MSETRNFLIPEHRKLAENELDMILKKYNLNSKSKLPSIKAKDFAISELDASIGDVIEITRESFAGKTKYYRVVVE